MWFLKISVMYPGNVCFCFRKKLINRLAECVTCVHACVYFEKWWCWGRTFYSQSLSYFWSSLHMQVGPESWEGAPAGVMTPPGLSAISPPCSHGCHYEGSLVNQLRWVKTSMCCPRWGWFLMMQAVAAKNVSLFSFSIRSVMQKYLQERNEITFDKIFNQKIGKSHLLIWHTVSSVVVLGGITVVYKCSPLVLYVLYSSSWGRRTFYWVIRYWMVTYIPSNISCE